MTEAFSFDLIDEPWIPCIRADDGAVIELSLRQVLAEAPQLREISDPSPLVTAALHRLLLAILHRTHGPRSVDEWATIWDARAFDTHALDRYLDEQQELGRFDLFHPEHPFYQTTGVHTDEPSYVKPMALLAHELLLGLPPTLFQQTPVDLAFSPARAARVLVALQAFAVGGLITYQSKHGEPDKPFKYSKEGPLKKGAVILTRGATLFATLMLNLHRYDGEDGAPWDFDPDEDLAAWERPVASGPKRAWQEGVNRAPTGYIDQLTWQSRRARLIPQREGDAVVVRRAVMMRGHGFPEDWDDAQREPMLAFRINRSAKADDPSPWITLTFDPDRALWRNSLALYQSVKDETRRPRMADWIADLRQEGLLPDTQAYAVDIFGMATNKSKIDLWRHERLPLPLELLIDATLAPLISNALAAAEDAARQLRPGFDERQSSGARKKVNKPRPLQLFGRAMLAPDDGREPDRQDVANLVASLDLDERYWSRLEAPFRDFLVDLPAERERALAAWLDAVDRAATDAFEGTMRSFDTSARALKAEALASARFRAALREALEPYRASERELAAEAES